MQPDHAKGRSCMVGTFVDASGGQGAVPPGPRAVGLFRSAMPFGPRLPASPRKRFAAGQWGEDTLAHIFK